MRFFKFIFIFLFSAAFLGCGGGGGSGGASASGGAAVSVEAGNVIFDSASSLWIYIKNSGAIEQSVLSYKVTSVDGLPAPGRAVNFEILDNNPYGLTLSQASSVADSDGVVQVTVFSGGIPGPVKIKAVLIDAPEVFAVSQNVTVSSSPPSQKFMSVSVDKYSIEGRGLDGAEAVITVRIADQQGNPVQDGTVVNFTTEGGQIAGSCATALSGGVSLCSVKLISQNFRPDNGRVSVLAYLEGIKEFVDLNSDNIYNGSDILRDIGDAYRDDDENGIYDNGEFLIPRGGAVVCAGAPVNSAFYYPARANTCSGTLRTTVRQQVVIAFSTSNAKVVSISATAASNLATFRLSSADPYDGLSMPAGTSVSVTPVDNTSGNSLSCAVDVVDSAVVPSNTIIPTVHSVYFSDCGVGDSLLVKVTAPSGFVTYSTLVLQ